MSLRQAGQVEQVDSLHTLTPEMQSYILANKDCDLSELTATLKVGGGVIKEFLLSRGISLGRKKPTLRLFNNFELIANNAHKGAKVLSEMFGVSQEEMRDFLIVNELG